MKNLRGVSVVGVSLGMHAAVLVGLWLIPIQLFNDQAQLVVETFFSEERDPREVIRELETDVEVAETDNVVSSSNVAATAVRGGQGPPVAQANVETSESLKEPELRVNPGEFTMPGDGELGDDYGEGLINGGMDVVGGYEPALGRISQELLRVMRQNRAHAVWLFDESDSMKDDQQRIRENFDKVYTELGIQMKSDEKLRKDKEVLWTSILSFGESVHSLTRKPTADINEIGAAINKIVVDKSGKENMCSALRGTLDKFGPMAMKAKRKLIIILVSDESGGDGQAVEEVIERGKRYKSPIYVLGRESVFGYPYTYVDWIDPVYNLTHHLQIDRGPETADPECLQWDGFHARWDYDRSGFGPYEQVRIARETGGVFFMLPNEEESLKNRVTANDARHFDFIDMKEYQPDLGSRRDYRQQRQKSKFRTQIWDVIKVLNPHLDGQLNVSGYQHYPMDPAEFAKRGAEEFKKGVRAMALAQQALAMLEQIQPLRASESSQRWRASYDLITAQLLSYRVRLFQFLLAIDQHRANSPAPQNKGSKKSNEWYMTRINEKLIEPDENQFAQIKKLGKLKLSREEFVQEMKDQEALSRKLFQFVIAEHPRTPWARRAQRELDAGYTVTFRDYYYDPNHYKVAKEIEFPKQ